MTSTTSDLNLTATDHRAGRSVWDRDGWNGNPQPRALTRWLLGIGGVALAAQGLRRRDRTGGVFAAVGGAIAWWALAGEGDLSEARRWFTARLEHAPWRVADIVHEASADSFPASDAPSWTPTVGTGLRKRS
jgi:hypothetical protein